MQPAAGQQLKLHAPWPRCSAPACLCAGETINPTGALALPRDGRTITLWNYDVAAFNAGVNLYGSHPFLLQLHQGTAMIGGMPLD